MKKAIKQILVGILSLSLVGCATTVSESVVTAEPTQRTVSDTEELNQESETKILVAYFSLAGEQYEVGTISKGSTQIFAEEIASQTGGDLYYIEPVEAYPDDYDSKLTIAQDERTNQTRPEIATTIDNFDEYDVIYIGYPIWWGGMPMIMYTFMESYDFTGKTVIPFNTHAGSGQGNTQNEVETELSSANVLQGLAIRGKTIQDDPNEMIETVADWISGLEY